MANIYEEHGLLVEQYSHLRELQATTEIARCFLLRAIHQLVDGEITTDQITFPEDGGINIAEPEPTDEAAVPDPPVPVENEPPLTAFGDTSPTPE